MSPLPSFSIIVPTYQRRDVVCDTVRAFCRLTYEGPVEIIVVVDGSTDGTAAALAVLDCPFPLRVIEQGEPRPRRCPKPGRFRGDRRCPAVSRR